MCRSKESKINEKTNSAKKINVVQDSDSSSEGEDRQQLVFSFDQNRNSKDEWIESALVSRKEIQFKIDTDAQCNVMCEQTAEKFDLPIQSTKTKKLVAFNGFKTDVVGAAKAKVCFKNETYNITFLVIKRPVKTILGLSDCKRLGIIKIVESVDFTEDKSIFDGLGCFKNYSYDIELQDNPVLQVRPARKIAHSIKVQVKKELDKMEDSGVIRKVTEATPVVSPMVVVKKNNKIRLCMDPSDLNKVIKRRHYPMKSIEEILANVSGAKFFSKLDCNKGFWQIKVGQPSQKYLTFATPWGRYCCTRLPFGLSSAPEVFQHAMQEVLRGLKNVESSMDDILIYASTKEKLREETKAVLSRVKENGVVLNKEKCVFEQTQIKFLGHILTEHGALPDPEKVAAVQKLETPSDAKSLQRFLGLVNYVNKFIPNLSKLTEPLRRLLIKDAEWCWDEEQEKTFDNIKKVLTSPPVLKYYDVNQDVTLTVDASSKAIGAALMQEGRPVAYATKSLTKSQQNYPQIEKEALAIRTACVKFHDYIYGKKVTVETDHKPLEIIFKKCLHQAPPRLQRLLFDVLIYNPKIVYKKGSELYIADTLSRDCKPHDESDDDYSYDVQVVLPFYEHTYKNVQQETTKDTELKNLITVIRTGWPEVKEDLPDALQQYWNFREELADFNGIIFKGEKAVIPASLRKYFLNKIHDGHLGIELSSRRARDSLFWINMSTDIKNFVESYITCQKTQARNVKEPILSKEIPNYPFQLVACDLFHFADYQYVLIVDSYSGFFDIKQLTHGASSEECIGVLKMWFAIHGVPEIFETDNGPQFSSKQFKEFARSWNFLHRTSSPGFPRSNGLAERYVQTAKNILKKCADSHSDLYLALLNYRNTPRSKDLGSPCQRLFNRITNSPLVINKDVLQPQIQTDVSEALKIARMKQKQYADQGSKLNNKSPVPGDNIRLQVSHKNWVGGQVVDLANSPRSYIVKTNDNQVFRRNSAHISKTKAIIPGTNDLHCSANGSQNESSQISNNADNSQSCPPDTSQTVQQTKNVATMPENIQKTTRSGRIIKIPEKLNL